MSVMQARPAMHGYGLRAPHYAELRERGPAGELVEVISENFIGRGGPARAVLERARDSAEVALHGVSLSLGAVDPLNEEYLRGLRNLVDEIEPRFVSDHLCFGTVDGHYGHDLWPLPYTEEAIDHVAARIREVQDLLQRQVLIENVSSYIEYNASEMPEWQFVSAVAERADCLLLLDLNNVVVSAKNHGFLPEQYLDGIDTRRVAQLHLAGHSDLGTHAIDDHGSEVPDAVWSLHRSLVRRMGRVPTIVEWDDNVPTLAELEAQSQRARENEQDAIDRPAKTIFPRVGVVR